MSTWIRGQKTKDWQGGDKMFNNKVQILVGVLLKFNARNLELLVE